MDVMDRTAQRTIYALIATLIVALGGLWVATRSDAPNPTYTDAAGGTWTCTSTGAYKGHPVLSCAGQDELDPSEANGGVRAFALPDQRVTFRVVRWGHTPDDTGALETGGNG